MIVEKTPLLIEWREHDLTDEVRPEDFLLDIPAPPCLAYEVKVEDPTGS